MDTLICTLNDLGKIVYIIDKPGWKYSDLQKDFGEDVVFIFDTLKIGCGEFGEQNPQEVSLDKWKDSFGMMQCIFNNGKPSAMFSVLPKFVVGETEVVKSFLMLEQRCNYCNQMKRHVKIKNSNGDIICSDCFDYHAATILLDNRVFDGVGSYIMYSN